jgi:MFS family permease
MADRTTRPWWLAGAAGVAIFMAMLDASVVQVALPSIQSGFGVQAAGGEWVVLGYTLALAALALPAGRWLDRAGRRASFVLALAGFAAASAMCALAPGLGWLVAARAVQGGFGSMIFALAPALVVSAVSPQRRARAMSIVALLGPLGAVSGPAIGGFLVGAAGWRAIFYINLPVAAAVIALARAALPGGGRIPAPGRTLYADAGLLGGAILAVLIGFGFTPSRGATWLLLLLPAAALFATWARRPASATVIQLARARGAGGPLAAMTLLTTATTIIQFLSPYYLERVLHSPPATVGLTVLAFPLAMAITGPVAGILADHVGTRRVTIAGTAVAAAAIALIVPLQATWGPADLAWRLAIAGIGTGLFIGPAQTAIMTASPRELMVSAGAASGLSRSLAFSFGPALATMAWALGSYRTVGMQTAIALAAALCLVSAISTGIRRSQPTAAPAPAPAPQPSQATR